MKEYRKDEIIKFFKSTVNPALEECKAGLNERGWKIDLQTHYPDYGFIGGTLSSIIHASKSEHRRECRFSIMAVLGSNPAEYRVVVKLYHDEQGEGRTALLEIDEFTGDANTDISKVTKDDLLKYMNRIDCFS